MIAKISEIFTAWVTSFNPSKEQQEIANYRATICDACPFKVQLDNALLKAMTDKNALLNQFKCGACGCVLSKKIFSPYASSCPKKYWEK